MTVQLKCLRCPLANEPCVEEAFKDVTCCGFEGWVVVDHMKELNTPMGISVSTGLCNKLEEVFCCDLGTHRHSTNQVLMIHSVDGKKGMGDIYGIEFLGGVVVLNEPQSGFSDFACVGSSFPRPTCQINTRARRRAPFHRMLG